MADVDVVVSDEAWWGPGFRSIHEAELLSPPDKHGVRRDVHLYVGNLGGVRGGPAGKAQAYLVHLLPSEIFGAHFHRIDQFQVFFGQEGVRYQRTSIPAGVVGVHYADAYSTYGPFSSGPDGLDFFTLRAVGDAVTAFMPESRDLLIHRGRRLLHREVILEEHRNLAEGETRSSTVISDDSDGLGCFALSGGPNALLCPPSAAGTGGQYYCIINGEAVVDGQSFGEKSIAWIVPDEEPLEFRAGDAGVTLLILQFPDPPSFPMPQS